jgi:hypothetical protein
MKAIAQRFLNSKLNLSPRETQHLKLNPLSRSAAKIRPSVDGPRPRSLQLLPPTPFIYIPSSHRRERPIIFCSFSISLIAINMNHTLINIEKTITYVPIRPFTLVKNIRQINLFMQNKAKVKMGKMSKIKPVLSSCPRCLCLRYGVEWTNSRCCAGKRFNDNSL